MTLETSGSHRPPAKGTTLRQLVSAAAGIAGGTLAACGGSSPSSTSGSPNATEHTYWYSDTTDQLVIGYSAPAYAHLAGWLPMYDYTKAEPDSARPNTLGFKAICVVTFKGSAQDPGNITWRVFDVSPPGHGASFASIAECHSLGNAPGASTKWRLNS
jgi:hypothetical protein